MSEAGQVNDLVTMGDGDGGARDGRGVDLFAEEPVHGGIVHRGGNARPCSGLLSAATTGGDPRGGWRQHDHDQRSEENHGAPGRARLTGGAHHRPAQREPALPHRGQWLRSTCWRSCPHQQEGRVQMTRSPTLCAEMSVIERIAFIFLTSLMRWACRWLHTAANTNGSPRSNDRDRRGDPTLSRGPVQRLSAGSRPVRDSVRTASPVTLEPEKGGSR